MSEPEATAPLWREPTQERSRLRVDAILRAAFALLEEGGTESLKMREVAARAGVPVGSLYQFFPDRDALLACLLARHLEGIDDLVHERFAGVTSVAEFVEAADGLLEGMHRALLQQPALVDISIGIQASRALRHLDVASSHRNARTIFRVLRPLIGPRVSDQRLRSACFLICDLWGSATRRALALPRAEGKRLVGEYAAMARAYMMSILEDGRASIDRPPK